MVVLWGTTAFGAIHTIAEYVAMIIFSERDWDDPPGTAGQVAPHIPRERYERSADC